MATLSIRCLNVKLKYHLKHGDTLRVESENNTRSLLVLVLKKFEALQNQNFLFRRQLGPSSPVNIKCQVSKFVFPRNNKVVSYFSYTYFMLHVYYFLF